MVEIIWPLTQFPKFPKTIASDSNIYYVLIVTQLIASKSHLIASSDIPISITCIAQTIQINNYIRKAFPKIILGNFSLNFSLSSNYMYYLLII